MTDRWPPPVQVNFGPCSECGKAVPSVIIGKGQPYTKDGDRMLCPPCLASNDRIAKELGDSRDRLKARIKEFEARVAHERGLKETAQTLAEERLLLIGHHRSRAEQGEAERDAAQTQVAELEAAVEELSPGIREMALLSDARHWRDRAEKAEARVRELEAGREVVTLGDGQPLLLPR